MKHVKIFERIETSLDYDKYNLDDKFFFYTEVFYDEETYEKQGKLSDIKNILNWTSIPIIN